MIIWVTLAIVAICLYAWYAVCQFMGRLDQPKQKERRLQPRTAEQAFTPKQQAERLKLQIESVSDFKVTKITGTVCGYQAGFSVDFTYLWQGYVLKSDTITTVNARVAIEKMQWIADNTKLDWWY